MASANKEEKSSAVQLKLDSGELLAALSYLTDIIPSGSYYHLWRVALVSERIAADIAPDIGRDVFYAGLLADIGAVGAQKHITHYATSQEQVDDVNIRVHTQRGAVLLDWLPGMGLAAQFVASHHEWWNGGGYPSGKSGDAIPMGSRILSAVVTASVAGCFRSKSNLRSVL
ncbi:MAG: HD domain-containing protein, partial [Armatimonadetes bacterium]|nr:HD domain-containing protein [Armatimonadota bacterium]